jgi:hypothetical protein
MAERTTSKHPIQVPDPLKYFSKDGPWVRLCALFICRLPYILAPVLSIGYFIGKSKNWW